MTLQVAGEVYAVDEFTFLIKNFVYDGNGPDTFFWAGSSTRPGPQGIIIPNEKGRTNVLQPYLNKDFTLKMPDNKKIIDVKWLSVYDLTLQVLQQVHSRITHCLTKTLDLTGKFWRYLN